jgi:hypothetical protein
MIRRLKQALGIPADSLIGEPKNRCVIVRKSGKLESVKVIKHAKPNNATKLASTKSAKRASGKKVVRKAAAPR